MARPSKRLQAGGTGSAVSQTTSPRGRRQRPLRVAGAAVCCAILVGIVSVTAYAAASSNKAASGAQASAAAAVPGTTPLPAGSFGASTTKKVTITLQGGGGGSNLQAINYVIKAFEAKYPNIKVKLLLAGDTSQSTQGTLISSSNPPDIVAISPQASYYAQLLSHHVLTPLTDLWAATSLKTRASSDVNSAFLGPDGKHYVVQNQKVFYGMAYYNVAMFQKLGIPAPVNHRFASLAQFYSDIAALKKGGEQGLTIGGKSGYEEVWPVDAMLPTASTKAQMANFLTSYHSSVKLKYGFSSGPFLKTIQTLHDFLDHNVFQAGFLGADEAGSQQPWLAGQAGMLLGGSWDAGGQRKAANFQYDWVLLPSIGVQPTQLTAGLDGDWGIPVKSKHIAEAKLFLSFFLTNAMQTKAIVQIESNLPVVNLPQSSLATLDPMVQQMLADAQKNGAQSGWASTVPNVQAVVVSDLESMWAGGTSPVAVAQHVQQTIAQLRSGG